MIEFFQQATSGFWMFCGHIVLLAVLFSGLAGTIASLGWAANALILGFKGKNCGKVKL